MPLNTVTHKVSRVHISYTHMAVNTADRTWRTLREQTSGSPGLAI